MKKLLVIANPYPPMASAGTTRVVRFLRHLPDAGLGAVGADGEGDRAGGSAARRARRPRRRCRGRRQLLGGGRRSTQGQQLGRRARPLLRAGSGRPCCKGREMLHARALRRHLLRARRGASVHLVAAVLSRADAACRGWPTTATRGRPTSSARTRRAAHKAAHARLEAWALRRAAAVTAVNRPIVDDLVARHPWLAGRAHVLPNGFDRAEQPADGLARRRLLARAHRPAVRPRAAGGARSSTALAALPPDVKALFVGVDESRVRPDADRLGLGDRVRVEPLVPLPVALGYQRAADALLLVNGRRPESMSSKVFEYLQAGRPIFAISPAGSAARALFAEVGGGTLRAARRPDGASRSPPSSPPSAPARRPVADPAALERYELGRLTAELAGLLDGLRRAARGGRPGAGERAGRMRA